MKDINLTIPVMALKVNVLNNPIKRKRLSDWIWKETRETICFLQETQFRFKITNRLKVKGWKEI